MPWLDQGKHEIDVLRADLCDPLISGNKYFKLKYNLQQARDQQYNTLLSFGGPWSNHLHALAAAGQRFGFKTIGVVRGERPELLNACLQDADNWGMQLHFISREDYRLKGGSQVLDQLTERFGRFLLIPEGGANEQGVRGCQEMLSPEQVATYTHLILACGTGTTMTGLISTISTPVIGIQVLKGKGYLHQQIQQQLSQYQLLALAPWLVLDDHHCGGYAKVNAELEAFLVRLAQSSSIPFEPVYSGKVMLALYRLIEQDYFPAGARILVVHGGGMQGMRGGLVATVSEQASSP